MITVLSIDGGGIRGIIPAIMLAELERRMNVPIAELFDVIAGTSTGGIIALMLTIPDKSGKPMYSAKQVEELYTKLGQRVFKRSALRTILSLGNLLNSKYSSLPLEKMLDIYMEECRLSDALTEIIVPAYETQSASPYFFKSSYARKPWNSSDNPLMSQAAMATCAAPTYFPPYQFSERKCFVDGGIFANNPAVCAYAQAKNSFPHEREFLVVSIGTGEHHVPLLCKNISDWGLIEWARPIFDIAMNAVGSTVNYQLNAMINGVGSKPLYHRFQVRIDEKTSKMDNVRKDNIACIKEYGTQMVQANQNEISKLCDLLKK